MRHIRWFGIVGFLWGVLIGTAEAGLVHRWAFDGNLQDSIGGSHGTLYNLTGNAQFVAGQLRLGNTGTQMSGGGSGGSANGDYVDLPNGIVSALGNTATFEAWVTWGGPSTSNWQRIFDFGRSTGGENVSNGGTSYVYLTPRCASGKFRGEYKDGTTVQYIEPTASLPVGIQQHVALVWDGTVGTAKMYLNGQPVGSNTLHMTLSQIQDVNNWLGRSQFNDPLFAGSYNEFRIYDHAMTDAEVLASFNNGVHLQQGLVHRWSFNGNLNDSVGSAHGTLVDPLSKASYTTDGKKLMLGNTGTELSSANNPGSTDENKGTYVDLPNGIISALGNHATFEAWVIWEGTGNNWQRIFDLGRSQGGEDISNTGAGYLMVTPRSSNARTELHYHNGTTTNTITTSSLRANDVVHMAVVWDGQASQVRFYLDGALIGTNATNMSLSNLQDINNWLGRSQYGSDAMFAGGYDEFRIYNRALSAFELGQSRLMGPDRPQVNANNAAYVAQGGPVHYIPIDLVTAVGSSNINYNRPVLSNGQQVLGGVPFVIADVNGKDSWNASYGSGDNRYLTIPINQGSITEANLLLGTWWGEKVAGTYASLLFRATTGEEFIVELDGNSDIRDYNQGSCTNLINNVTTTMVLQEGAQRVDMLKVILPDSWRFLTLESITIRDFGASGSGAEGFQRIILSGLTLGTVPEPSSLALLAVGGLTGGFLVRRWRRKRT